MQPFTKKDYFLAAGAGLLTAVFSVPTLLHLGVRSAIIYIFLVIAIPPLWALGVWLGGFLSRWFPFFAQFGKFAAVGFSSTAIDFGVLNIFSLLSGVTAGFIVGGVNAPGFTLAIVNSYLWNKLWVFQHKSKGSIFSDFPKFLAVTFVGLLLNSGIVIFVTTYLPPLFSVGSETWLNIAKAAATGVVLIWNFWGFKFIVFRAK